MKFFADTRSKRNTAFAMLLVWLFALASGVANACFLEAPGSHARAAQASTETASHAPAELLAHLGAPAGHHDKPGSTKESCLKVCDDGMNAVVKAYAGFDHTDPGPATLVTTLWVGSASVVPAPHRLDDLAIPIVGPPIRVRYARLAL